MYPIKEIIRYRSLILYLVQKQDQASLFGAVLGRGWLLLEPLMQVVTYYLLIVVIFKAGASYGVNPLALLLMGITHFLFFRTIIIDITNSVVNNESILMQIKIHPIIFPAVALWAAVKSAVIPIGLYWVVHLSAGLGFGFDTVMYPVLLITLTLLATSIGLFCAVPQVYARDVTRLLNIILRLLMYAVPALYTVQFVPEKAQFWFLLNPVATLFSELQASVFSIKPVSYLSVSLLILFTLTILFIAICFFNKKASRLAKAL